MRRKNSDGSWCEEIELTPDLAQLLLLKRDPRQRTLNPSRVSAYAREMKAGNWKQIHEPFQISKEGFLIQGQHRACAVIESGTAITVDVVWDAPYGMEAPLDMGRPRSLAFVLGISNREVSIVNQLAEVWGHEGRATESIVRDMREKHGPDIEFALEWMCKSKSPRTHAGIYTSYALAFPIAPQKVADFANRFHTGEMLTKGDPALALRAYFDRRSKFNLKPGDARRATASCLKSFLQGKEHAMVFGDAVMGQKWLLQRRRALKLPAPPYSTLEDLREAAE